MLERVQKEVENLILQVVQKLNFQYGDKALLVPLLLG
jgi:hypothetical protein